LVARWEVYRMPQPREAATTLHAMADKCVATNRFQKIETICPSEIF